MAINAGGIGKNEEVEDDATSPIMLKAGPSSIQGVQDAIVREFEVVHLKGSDSPTVHPAPSTRGSQSQGVTETSSSARNKPCVDGQGLIVPRKLNNPCIDSKDVQNLTKEIKWNKRTGTNVLASKSELDKALDRRRWQQGKYEAKQEADAAKTDFQKAMEQRAQRVNHMEKTPSALNEEDCANDDSGHCSPEPEFMKVRAQVKSKSSAGNR